MAVDLGVLDRGNINRLSEFSYHANVHLCSRLATAMTLLADGPDKFVPK
jgi:hypothetical protein